MAFDWDESSPLANSLIADFPANEVAARTAARGSVDVDHDADGTGKHEQVSLDPLGADPTPSGTNGFVYTKTVSGVTELFYADDTPSIIQLTDNGSASPDKVAKAGDSMTGDLDMQAADLLTDNDQGLRGEVVATGTYHSLAKLNTDDDAEFGDQSVPTTIQSDADTGLKADYPASGGVKTVWHEGNQGTGSGMDSDTVDGIEAEDILSTLADGGGRYFESGEKAITSTAGGTEAHLLGSVPRMVLGFLRCKVANANYSVNDEVPIAFSAAPASFRGAVVGADATVVFYRLNTGLMRIFDKTTGAEGGASNTDWKLFIRAWK